MIDEELVGLFNSMTLVNFPTNTALFRGDWVTDKGQPLYNGAVWLHKTMKGAAGYVNFGKAHGEKTAKHPVIYQAQTERELRLARYEGSHISDFSRVYGTDEWTHAWLRRDLPEALKNLDRGPADGFFIEFEPDRVEYFILDAEENLRVTGVLADAEALAEGTKAQTL